MNRNHQSQCADCISDRPIGNFCYWSIVILDALLSLWVSSWVGIRWWWSLRVRSEGRKWLVRESIFWDWEKGTWGGCLPRYSGVGSRLVLLGVACWAWRLLFLWFRLYWQWSPRRCRSLPCRAGLFLITFINNTNICHDSPHHYHNHKKDDLIL